MAIRSAFSVAVLVASVFQVDALRLSEPTAEPAMVALDFERGKMAAHSGSKSRKVSRRDGGGTTKTVLEQLSANDGLLPDAFFANVSIGTPPQVQRLVIDTGSSDLWTYASNNPFCATSDADCKQLGVYNPNASTTFKHVDNDFFINYLDDTYASGEFGNDTWHVGDIDIPLQFGVALKANSSQGILGLGYPGNENQNDGKQYPNLPRAILEKGLVKSNAFSLYHNDPHTSTGSLLFGAVDTERFMGDLATLPLIKSPFTPNSTAIADFWINVTNVQYTSPDGKSESVPASEHSFPLPALVDTGTTSIDLPEDLAVVIWSKWDVHYVNGSPVADCSSAKSKATVSFVVGTPGKTITMTAQELVLDEPGYTMVDGSKGCLFAIDKSLPTAGDTIILGYPFFRRNYMVFDLTSNEWSIAPTNFFPKGSHIMEIEKPLNTSVVTGAPSSSVPATAFLTAPTSTPTGKAAAKKSAADRSAVSQKSTFAIMIAGMFAAGVLFA